MLLLLLACDRAADLEPVCSDDLLHAPAPVDAPEGTLAPVDLLATTAQATLTESGVSITATTRFLTSDDAGLPTFELAPDPTTLTLDGNPVDLTRTQVGNPERQVVALDATLDPCTEHTLEVAYDLPLGWQEGDQARLHELPEGVFFSAGLEDASAGTFLGMWLPSNLLFDRFDLDLGFTLPPGHSLAHTGTRQGDTVSWSQIQAHAPFWVVSPDAATVSATFTARPAEGDVMVEVYALESDLRADLDEAGARAVVAIETFASMFGPYAHGDRYVLWIRNDQGGSMEYDGATQTAMGAIEHEIMHSWYARGASPRSDADGWIDEAITSWVTDLFPLRANPVPYDVEPTQLRFGQDGWDGPQLDIEQYVYGSAIFADIAYRYSVDEVVEALGAFYRERANASYSDVELEEHLTCWFDAEVRAAFYHQAYAGPAPPVPPGWCAVP